jgi:UDP-2,3-diacylglucosamine pyrophosphatase LpxH
MKLTFIAAASLFLFFSNPAWSEDLDLCPGGRANANQRHVVAISDLHLGSGRRPGGSWYPTEDFRWDGALRTFLDRVSECSEGRTDLVVAGDLLELWQPLPQLRCKSKDGCTVAEMVAITKWVVEAHSTTLGTLKDFASHGDNRIHIVPGNHDAALLLPDVWRVFQDALRAPHDRVRLVQNGLWVSRDGIIIIEHGHQIGLDVNRFDTWPRILQRVGDRELVVQSWGENFVQSLFNAEEEEYSIIDNLSPETAGARYRMVDRGLWRSTQDMARFLAFNLFETSIQQKASSLGHNKPGDPKWDLAIARKMGHLLFVNAMVADDPFRQVLLSEDPSAVALRRELDAQAMDAKKTTDAEVEMLCDHIAIRKATQCAPSHLGAGVQNVLIPRKRVMLNHLRSRIAQSGLENARVFIYGHTHLLEDAWTIDVSSFVRMTVLNTGAFQRVVDEVGFLTRVKSKSGLKPSEALRTFKPEDLAPCYAAVLVSYDRVTPRPQTVLWHAPEGVEGRFVTTADARCR